MASSFPQNPIAAVTHPNPYPYYSNLIDNHPIYFDAGLGMWVVSSAELVFVVLANQACRVRPRTEQVPRTLNGSFAGDVYRRLIRMNDGESHRRFKHAMSKTMEVFDTDSMVKACKKWSHHLIYENPSQDPSWIQNFAFRLPIYVVASLLGVSEDKLSEIELWVNHFVRGIAPNSSAEQVSNGTVAAQNLFENVTAILNEGPEDCLLPLLTHQAKSVGCDDKYTVTANAIGLLSQTYEATGGLLLNCINLLRSTPNVYAQVKNHVDLLPYVVDEVLRYDPPIQNTRRYVSQDVTLAGHPLSEGDTILVVLAAANRDPSSNPKPGQFDMFRRDRRVFTFGLGPHVCPGEKLAKLIAWVGLEYLITSEVEFQRIHPNTTYMPSMNARIPILCFV